MQMLLRVAARHSAASRLRRGEPMSRGLGWIVGSLQRVGVPVFPQARAATATPMHSLVACRHQSTAKGFADEEDDVAGSFAYDPAQSLAIDQTKQAQADRVQSLVSQWMTELGVAGASAATPSVIAAKAAVVKRLTTQPINDCILCAQVAVTHVQNDAGEDMRLKMPPAPYAEVRKLIDAEYPGMDLVQFAESGGTAYCRVRKAQREMIATLSTAAGLDADDDDDAPAAAPLDEGPKRPVVQHVFRDVVDSHFIGWKSTKVVDELKRGHPVKLTIQQFQNAEMAIEKMKEFMDAIKEKATTSQLAHQYTGVHASERELSIMLKSLPASAAAAAGQKASPVTNSGRSKGNASSASVVAVGVTIRHPTPQEWDGIGAKMVDACDRNGSKGTYRKSGALKARNLGMRTVRVDKYGRVIGDVMDGARPMPPSNAGAE